MQSSDDNLVIVVVLQDKGERTFLEGSWNSLSAAGDARLSRGVKGKFSLLNDEPT